MYYGLDKITQIVAGTLRISQSDVSSFYSNGYFQCYIQAHNRAYVAIDRKTFEDEIGGSSPDESIARLIVRPLKTQIDGCKE